VITLQWFRLSCLQLLYCNNLFTVVVAFTVMDSSSSLIALKTVLRGPGSARWTLFGLSHCPQSSSFEPDLDIATMLLLLSGFIVGFHWLSVGCFSACWGCFSTCWLCLSLCCFSLVNERYVTKKKKKKKTSYKLHISLPIYRADPTGF
jgi:hypothetical protein